MESFFKNTYVGCVLMFLSFTFSVADVSAQNLVDDLVSYWNMDSNTADDIGPNSGTIVGTGFAYTPAKFGSGIDLDGGNTYVNAGNDPSLNMTGKSLTISAWFRVDAFDTQWQALVVKGENNNFRLARSSNSNTLRYNGTFPSINGTTNINDAMFHHVVAITEMGVSKRIYIDGMLQASAATGLPIADSGEPLFIGANPEAAGREWNGVIDDVAIWERALTEAEIELLATSDMSIGAILASQAIPTLSQWALFILGLCLTSMALVTIKKFVLIRE